MSDWPGLTLDSLLRPEIQSRSATGLASRWIACPGPRFKADPRLAPAPFEAWLRLLLDSHGDDGHAATPAQIGDPRGAGLRNDFST